MQNVKSENIRFKDINQAAEITSLGKSTIRLWEAEGRFPKSIRLSATKRVWLESHLNIWMMSKCDSLTGE